MEPARRSPSLFLLLSLIYFISLLSWSSNAQLLVESGSGSASGSGRGLREDFDPVIVQGPQSQAAVVEESIELSCIANYTDSIEWLKDGNLISSSMFVALVETEDDDVLQGTLSFNASLTDSGDYVCNASNQFGYVLSDPATITIFYPTNVTVSPSGPVTINETDNVILTCQGFGVPLPTLTWLSNETMLGSGGGPLELSLLTNVTDEVEISVSAGLDAEGRAVTVSVLTLFTLMKVEENITYTCNGDNGVVNNIGAVSSLSVSLIIQVPPSVSVNGRSTVLGIVGQRITLSFNITNDDPRVTTDNIKWIFSNADGSTDITGLSINGFTFSGDLLSLSIIGVSHSNEGNYTLIARNPAGSAEATVTLEVEAGPVIIDAPASQEVLSGQDVVLNCTSVSEPLHSVVWFYNSTTEIVRYNATTRNFFLISNDKYTFEDPSTPMYGTLTIRNASLTDAGSYTCTVSNVHMTQSASALLQVQLPPNVNISSFTLSGIYGDTTSFTCTVRAFPTPTVTWTINGSLLNPAIDPGASISFSTPELNTSVSVLTLSGLTLDDNGGYQCHAVNDLVERIEAESESFNFSVFHPPNVTTLEPREIIINQTQPANFTCQAYGIPTPSISWINMSSGLIVNPVTGLIDIMETLLPPATLQSVLVFRNGLKTDESVYTCIGINNITNIIQSPEQDNITLLVQVPVEIVDDPVNTTHFAGGNVTLSCNASGIPLPTFQWYKNNQLIIPNDRVYLANVTHIETLIESLVESVLVFNDIVLSDDDTYHCQATNPGAHGRIFNVFSQSVRLTVHYPPNVTTFEPREIIINQTQPANFTCQAYGIPTPSISWINVSSGLIVTPVTGLIDIMETLIPPATLQSVLVFRNGLKTDESVYTCIGINNITNIIQSPEQDNITLLVQVPVEIVDDPVNTTHFAGGNVTLSCNASGIPLPTFQWYKNNQLIVPNNRVYLATVTHIETLIESLVESVLVFNDIVLSDDDTYHCQATNPGAHGRIFNVFSQSVRLTVHHPPNTTVTPSQIIVNSTTTPSITFSCYSFGIPSPSLQWIKEKDGVLLTSLGPTQILSSSTDSSSTSVLTLFSPRDTEESNYTCIAVNNVTNVLGTPEYDVGELYVQDPVMIVDHPASRTHPAGFSFIDLTCRATGLPVPSIYWYKDGVLLVDDGDHIQITDNDYELSDFGINFGRLHIVDVVLSDDGDYVCVAINTGAPGITFNVSSQVAQISVQYPPLVTVSPSSLTLNQTDPANFTCNIFGIPRPTFNWFNGSTLLSFSSSPLYSITNTTDTYNITSVLTIFSTQRTDMGSYTCSASNGINNLIDSPEQDSAELFVQEPSRFLLEPFNTSNYTAGSITLSCQATGIPLPSISWFKDGRLVVSESDDRINITTISFVTQNERNITSFLSIDSLVLSDTGYYHCSTSNDAASGNGVFSDRTESAYLFVQYPPMVSVTPTLTITNQTNSTSFNCSLFGVPTPAVTWTHIGSNGRPVATLSPPGSDPFITTVVDGYNVTSVLLFNSSMATDEGEYVCAGRNDVFNAIGVPESASVSLFVQVPSLFIAHPQSVTNYTAGSASFSCTVYGLPVPSILWLKDGEILAETDNLTIITSESFTNTTGRSISVLSIVNLSLEDAGVYHCMANNTGAMGNSFTVNSLQATLVVQYPPSLIISPVRMTVNQTDRVSITCTVFAVPPPQITWTDDREEANIPLTPIQDTISITETDSDNTRTSVLTFNSIVKLNESNYTCTAVNNVTNVINAVDQGTSSITVQVPATVTSLVGFTLHRQNGDNATMTFSLSEDSPLVKTENIRWFLRTVSSFEDITFRSDSRQTLSEDRLSLLIDGITETDEGEYILRATNEAGIGEGTIVISVAGPPAIINGPVNQRKIEGDSVTFNCFATGDPIPEVTWRFNNSLILTNNTKYSIGDITEGISFGSLTISDLNYFDKGTYDCTASNVNGTSSLDVLLEIQVVPVVTVHPLTQDVIAGGVVTLNCTAYGFPGIDIKWLKNGVVITQDLIPESSVREERGSLPEDITVSSYLTIEDLQLRDVANYSCNVSNGLVEDRLEYSDNAELTVLYPPNVDVTPKSFIVNQTQPVNFTCTAYGIPPPKLTWYDTRNISEPLRRSQVLYVVEDLYTNGTGFSLVESVLVFASALRTDASVYTCIATNDIENLLETPETGDAVLYVQLPALIQSSPPERVDHFRGGTINISCSATGLPLPTITWFKDGAPLEINDRIYFDEINETMPTSGFIRSTLVFQVLELADNGSYYCEANNTGAPGNEFLVSSGSSFIFITHPPNVTVSPETQLTVNVTFTATITCSVFAIPLPHITWINNTDDSIVVGGGGGGGTNRITITETDYTHVRVSVLNFTSTVKSDESVYTCMAVNNISNVLDTPEATAVMLRIQVPANIIPITPSPSFGVEGQSIELTFFITQDDPLVNTSNIRWTFRGTAGLLDITETDSPHYELIDERRSLVITQITSAHQGVYTLFATNEAGTRSNSIILQLQGPPVFYRLPSDQTLLERSAVTFQCLAIGDPFPSVSWSFNDEILEDSRYIIGDVGQNFGSLTIPSIRFSDRGRYTCMYNNTHGTVIASAALSVQVIPVIVDLAVPANGTAGSDTILSCISTGYPAPTISWFINDTLVVEQNNDKMSINVNTMEEVGGLYNVSSTLLINELELRDTNVYHCTATNELESVQTVTSHLLQFTVLYPPNITESPANMTINQTDDGVFSCTFFSIPLSTVNWFFNDTQLEDDGVNDITIQSYSHSMDQYITSSLTVSNALRANNEGGYTCTASNGVDNLIGAIESSVSFLTVQVPPTVVSDLSTYLGVVHESVTISFKILHASPLVNITNIQWFFNDTRLTGSESRYNFSSDLLSLIINNLQHSDEGVYTLIASNEAGTNSTSVFLEIEAAPEIVLPPSNSSILEGDKVTFECRTTSEPLHTVQWFFEDTPIDTNGVKYRVSSNEGTYGDLTVFDVELNDTGSYTCTVNNTHGIDTASAYLQVQVIPQFTRDPMSIVRLIRDNVSMNCEAFGVPPPNITWFKGTDPLDLSSPLITSTNNTIGHITSSEINITLLSFSDDSDYYCTATNVLVSVQTTRSAVANLTVHMPVIITDSNNDAVVNETDTVQFSCTANGLPEPSFVWSTLHDIDINDRSDVKIANTTSSESGSVSVRSVLTFDTIKETDATRYTCTASNRPGGDGGHLVSVSASFNVTVQTKPVVQFTIVGPAIGVEFSDIYLSINITRDLPSVLPQDINWFYDTTTNNNNNRTLLTGGGEEGSMSHYALSEDRLSLEIFNLSLSDSGVYSAEASNIVGTGSSNIILTVQKAPVIISPLRPLKQLSGTNATFTCTAIAVPQHTIDWYKEEETGGRSQPLANDTKYYITGLGTPTSVLTIIDIQLSDNGTYTCFADNLHGNDSTSDTLLVQVRPSYSVYPEERLDLIANDSVSMTCNVSGYPRPTVSILKDGVIVNESQLMDTGNSLMRHQVNTSLMDGTLYSSVTLLLSSLTYSDTANYSCTASNNLASEQTEVTDPVRFVVQYPPNVTVLPVNNITVNETDSTSFICMVFGIPPPNIQWSMININDDLLFITASNDSYNITVTTTPHQTFTGSHVVLSNLSLPMIDKRQEGHYTCSASNGVTNLIGTPESDSISLTVQVPPLVRPLASQLLGVVNGSINLTFTIERSSPSVLREDIIWTFAAAGGVETVPLESSNRSQFSPDGTSLLLTNLQDGDEGIYTVTASNPAGINYSNINLTIESAPVFTVRPVDSSRLQGEAAIFNCSATSEPVHSIRWEREGVTIAYYVSNEARGYTVERFNDSIHSNASTNMLPAVIKGVNATINGSKYVLNGDETSQLYGQLIIYNTVLNDATNYTCTISNVHGTIASTASLTVQVTPSFPGKKGETPILAAGQNFSISCNTQGQPLPNVTWYKNGLRIQESERVFIVETTDSHSVINSTLRIVGVTVADEGVYHCVAVNFLFVLFEEVSPTTNITVQYPANVVSGPPGDITRQEVQYVSISCTISGLPPPEIQWTANNTQGTIQNTAGKYYISTTINTDINAGVNTDTDTDSVSGPYNVSSHLLILNLTLTDQQRYTCTGVHSFNISNFIGAVSSASTVLFVRVPPRVSLVTDSILVVLWNTSITLSFKISSSQPPITPSDDVVWTFTSRLTGGEEELSYNETGTRYSFTKNRCSLTIDPVRVNDTGSYKLTASNVGGSSSAVINIQQVLAGPVIGEGSNLIVNGSIGDSITFNCTADGIPNPSLTWRHNGTLLTTGSIRWTIKETSLNGQRVRDQLDTEQSVLSQLTLNKIDQIDHGSLISCQADNSVNESVLTYTLIVNDIPRDACVSSPCMNGGTCYPNGGSFKCVCTGSYTGTTCQDSATVSVGPTIITSPQPVSSPLFSPVNLSCIVEGNPTPRVDWYKDGREIVDQHNTHYYISGLRLEDRGEYWCTATNQLASPHITVSSTPALVTINNVAQYIMTISSTQDYQLLVNMMNQDIVGSNIYNNTLTIFSIELHNTNDNSSTAVILVTVVIATEEGSGCPLSCREELVEYFNLRGASFNPSFTVIDNITRFDGCESEVTNSTFNWAEVNIGSVLRIGCPCGGLSLGTGSPVAIRACTGNFTNGASWTSPNITQCDFANDALSLCNVTQMPTVESSIQSLQSLVSADPKSLSSLQLAIAVSTLERYINDIPTNDNLTLSYVNIVTSLLGAELSVISAAQSQYNISSRITDGLERLTEVMSLLDQSNRTLEQSNLFVLSAESITSSTYSGTQFSVLEDSGISLPPDLLTGRDFVDRLVFSYYYNSRLTSVLFESVSMTLVSSVLAASASGATLTNLSTPVNISFGMVNSSQDVCVYWDFTASDGRGDWSAEGCETMMHNSTVTCLCNHLTHFALAKPTTVATSPHSNSQATSKVLEVLEILSMICVGVSLLCIAMSLLVHVFSRKLRIKPPIQLLVNVCVSLILLYLMYIGALYARTQQNACIVFSYLFQYTFSVSLLALLGQMVSVVFLGIKLTFPVIISIISWITPMFYVGLLSPFYSQISNDKLCRPDNIAAVMSLILPLSFALIIAAALGILMLIRWYLTRGNDSNQKRPRGTARRHLILFAIFVTGWVFGLLRTLPDLNTTAYIVFESLFIVTGALFGLYFFVLHCLLVYDVRVCFKRVFYKMTCREYSEHDDQDEGSRRGTMTPESFVLAKSLAEKGEKRDPGNIEMTDYIYSVPNKKRLSKEKEKAAAGYVQDSKTGYVHSLKEIQEVKANLGRLDSELSSPSRSEDFSTDLPVAKFPSVAFASNEKLDSSAIDQPDPDEETEL